MTPLHTIHTTIHLTPAASSLMYVDSRRLQPISHNPCQDEQDDPNFDPELNKYLPLVAYGLKIVARTTTLITTNVAAAIQHFGVPALSDSIANTLQSLTMTKYAFPHFHDEYRHDAPLHIAEPPSDTVSFLSPQSPIISLH